MQHPYDHNLRSPYEDNMLMMAAREGKCDAVQFLLDSLKNISEEGVLTDFQSVLPQGDAFPGYQEHTHGNLGINVALGCCQCCLPYHNIL